MRARKRSYLPRSYRSLELFARLRLPSWILFKNVMPPEPSRRSIPPVCMSSDDLQIREVGERSYISQ